MEGSCPSVNEKKFLPTSDVLNRGNEGGTGVQMFLDEPETKEGQFRGTKEILPTSKSQIQKYSPVNFIDSRNS